MPIRTGKGSLSSILVLGVLSARLAGGVLPTNEMSMEWATFFSTPGRIGPLHGHEVYDSWCMRFISRTDGVACKALSSCPGGSIPYQTLRKFFFPLDAAGHRAFLFV